MGERLAPVDHGNDSLVAGFASAVSKGASRIAKKDSDPHTLQVVEVPTANITYILPDGVDTIGIILTEPGFMRKDQGVFFHFTQDPEGIRREVAMTFETMPGAPTQVVSKRHLTTEEIEALTQLITNPALNSDLARNFMALTRAEKQIKDEETDRLEEELDIIREDCEDVTFVPQRGHGW